MKPVKRFRTNIGRIKSNCSGIKGNKSMSEDDILSALNSSKPAKTGKKPKANFSKARIKNIRKNSMNQGINFLN